MEILIEDQFGKIGRKRKYVKRHHRVSSQTLNLKVLPIYKEKAAMKTNNPLDIQGCINLVGAVIAPDRYHKPDRAKKVKEELPELGREWVEVASMILDMDVEEIVEVLEGVRV